MPIIHDNHEPMTSDDLQAIQELMRGSLSNITGYIESQRNLFKKKRDPEGIYNPIAQIYQDAVDALPERFREAQRRKEAITVTSFMQAMYDELAEKVIQSMDPNHQLYTAAVNTLFSQMGGTIYPPRFFPDVGSEPRDKQEVYQAQVDTFKLAEEPMEGVEDITEYQPESGRILSLYDARSGNSRSLRESTVRELEERVNRLKNGPENKLYLEAVKELEDVRKAPFGLHAGAEYARIRSSEMKAREYVSFADVYETFTNINKLVRPGDREGGALRGGSIVAGNLMGPGATAIPMQLYQTLSTIADHMNTIKQTADPALQKTQAIQLAAFAYQMTLAEHVFNDANGRTCRMFADSILQTFGLPPHTPTSEESDIMKTLGEEGGMDFQKGAEVFLANVKKSDQELKKDPEIVKDRLSKEMPEKKPGGRQEKYSLKLSAIYEVSDETVETLRRLKEDAKNAKGRFRDSKQYKNFREAIDKSYQLATSIRNQQGTAGFDEKKADAEYASSIRKLFKTAADYKTYKMQDHTANRLEEPGKKALNQQDEKKMNVINSLTEEKGQNRSLTKVKQDPPAPGL